MPHNNKQECICCEPENYDKIAGCGVCRHCHQPPKQGEEKCTCQYEKDNGHSGVCPLYKEKDWNIIFTPEKLEKANLKSSEEMRDTFCKSYYQKGREDVLREISEEVEKLVLYEPKIPIPQIRGDSYRMGHNKALDAVLSIMRGK